MKMRFFIFILINIISRSLLATQIIIKPSIFSIHSSNGSDWMYQNKPINIFGLGVNSHIKNNDLKLTFNYLQIGLLGNVNQDLFEFSPQQSYPYIDDSKDAEGYWTEHIEAKLIYEYNNLAFEFGKFNRHWGYGYRSLHISDKAPSYPQIGFKYNLNTNLNYLYFHGFLNSGIPDTTRSIFYNNNYSKRFINVPRNIAAHRVEWKPNDTFLLSINETVVYATRAIDIYYLIPILPFYPIENYIGDTDNIQMGFELLYKINDFQGSYIAFFMDEFTPEWLLKSKNHNWFGLQLGYYLKNLIFKNSKLQIEYNWTDQRIYMHKYDINDFYNHQQPLGFWAGPHAEEFLVNYQNYFKKKFLKLHFSHTKRGLNNRDMVADNYKDMQSDRFSLGSEERLIFSTDLKVPTKIEDLFFTINFNYIKFSNAGIKIIDDHLNQGIDSEKISFDFGIFYNFTSSLK